MSSSHAFGWNTPRSCLFGNSAPSYRRKSMWSIVSYAVILLSQPHCDNSPSRESAAPVHFGQLTRGVVIAGSDGAVGPGQRTNSSVDRLQSLPLLRRGLPGQSRTPGHVDEIMDLLIFIMNAESDSRTPQLCHPRLPWIILAMVSRRKYGKSARTPHGSDNAMAAKAW